MTVRCSPLELASVAAARSRLLNDKAVGLSRRPFHCSPLAFARNQPLSKIISLQPARVCSKTLQITIQNKKNIRCSPLAFSQTRLVLNAFSLHPCRVCYFAAACSCLVKDHISGRLCRCACLSRFLHSSLDRRLLCCSTLVFAQTQSLCKVISLQPDHVSSNISYFEDPFVLAFSCLLQRRISECSFCCNSLPLGKKTYKYKN